MTTEQNRNRPLRPDALLRRKLLLGLAASYREIGDRIGASQTAVRAVLTQKETGVEMNRGRMLTDIARAISEIEAEQEKQAA